MPVGSFQEKMMYLLCPSEKMAPHFKQHMETFSYFVRWVQCLILTFYQVNKTGDKKNI